MEAARRQHERAWGAAPQEEEEVAVQLQADDVRAAQAGDDAQLRDAEIEGRHEASFQMDEGQVARRQVEDEPAEEDELRRVGQLDDDRRLAAHETAGPIEFEHRTEQDATRRGREQAGECSRDTRRVTLRIVGEEQRAERPVEHRTREPVEVGATREPEDPTDARDRKPEADLDPGLREPGAHHDEERQRLPVGRRPQHTERGDGERRDLEGERTAPVTLRRVQEHAAARDDRQVDRHADASERWCRDDRRRPTGQAESDLDTELGGAQRHRCGGNLHSDVGPYGEPQLRSSAFGAHADAHTERLHVERPDLAGAWEGHVERGIAVQHEAELRIRGDLHVESGQFGPRDDRGEQLGQQRGIQARQAEGEIDGREGLVGAQQDSQVHAAATEADSTWWGRRWWIEIDLEAQLCTRRTTSEGGGARRWHRHGERRRRVAAQREVHPLTGDASTGVATVPATTTSSPGCPSARGPARAISRVGPSPACTASTGIRLPPASRPKRPIASDCPISALRRRSIAAAPA